LGVRRASGWIDTSVSLDTLKGKKREEENCKQKRKKIRKKGGVDMCQRSDCMLCISISGPPTSFIFLLFLYPLAVFFFRPRALGYKQKRVGLSFF
jgi:hypothetical protein